MNINDLPLSVLIFFLSVVFISSIIKGTTAFGFNLIATPLMLLFFEPQQAVVILLPLTTIVNIGVIFWNRERPVFNKVLILGLSGLVGIPVGIFVLLHSDPDILKILIGIIILFFASIIVLLPKNIKIKRGIFKDVIVGFASGVLVTSTSLSGPLIILYLTAMKIPKVEFRRIVACFLLILHIFGLIALLSAGTVTQNTMILDLKLLPALIAGFLISMKLVNFINENFFRLLALGIVILAAISAIVPSVINFAYKN